MVIHHDARPVLDRIDKFMKLKESSIGDPDIYLGAKLRQVKMPNGVYCWGISPSKYVQEAVRNCEIYLKEHYPEEQVHYEREQDEETQRRGSVGLDAGLRILAREDEGPECDGNQTD